MKNLEETAYYVPVSAPPTKMISNKHEIVGANWCDYTNDWGFFRETIYRNKTTGVYIMRKQTLDSDSAEVINEEQIIEWGRHAMSNPADYMFLSPRFCAGDETLDKLVVEVDHDDNHK